MAPKISGKRIDDVFVQQGTLCHKRVNLFPFNLPRDPIDQKSVFDGVVLTQNRVFLEFCTVKDLHIYVNQKIQLGNCHRIKMLVDEEQLHFMEQMGVF